MTMSLKRLLLWLRIYMCTPCSFADARWLSRQHRVRLYTMKGKDFCKPYVSRRLFAPRSVSVVYIDTIKEFIGTFDRIDGYFTIK